MHPIVDWLVYCSYHHNRTVSPNVTVEQWRTVFGDKTDVLETRYQEEKKREEEWRNMTDEQRVEAHPFA